MSRVWQQAFANDGSRGAFRHTVSLFCYPNMIMATPCLMLRWRLSLPTASLVLGSIDMAR